MGNYFLPGALITSRPYWCQWYRALQSGLERLCVHQAHLQRVALEVSFPILVSKLLVLWQERKGRGEEYDYRFICTCIGFFYVKYTESIY